ncbi:MAG: drug/metabolite transporter (DMT)-like permease [Cocleimonas sp.]|jgi:drug/metabolite transporter (DMT)-like permease
MRESLKNNLPLLGVLLSLSGATFFALSITTARWSYDYNTNTQTVMLVRFVTLIAIMLIWNKRKNISLKLPKEDAVKCSILGAFYFMGIASYLASVAYMPVGLAVLILYTFPILVILSTAILNRRKPSLLQLFAVVIAFIGLFIALDINADNTQPIGIILATMAAVGVTINMIGSADILKRIDFSLFGLYQAVVVAAISALLVLFTGGLSLPDEPKGWIILGVMLLSFIIAYLSVYTSLKVIGAVRTSTIMNLEPIMTIIFAIALLQEQMTIEKLIGGVIVLFAILLAQLPQIKTIFTK